jgi:uncharacterized membrane protein
MKKVIAGVILFACAFIAMLLVIHRYDHHKEQQAADFDKWQKAQQMVKDERACGELKTRPSQDECVHQVYRNYGLVH